MALAYFIVNLPSILLLKQVKNLEIRNAIWGLIILCMLVGVWYVSGNIGFLAEHPDTLESKYILTNSGKPESFSFIGPLVYLPNSFYTKVIVVNLFHLELSFSDYCLVPIYQPVYKKV